MNVLHFKSAFPQGGAEKLLLYFLKASKEDVTVAIMNDEVDEYLKQELLITCSKVYFLNRKLGHKHPKYLFPLMKIIKENKIDIIHSHDPGSMMWSILCKIIKPKLKLVLTIHSSVFVKNWNKITLFCNRNFINSNIAISETILNDCIQNNLKTVKIFNGIDTKKWEQHIGGAGTFSIITVGRITYEGSISYQIKGHDILLKALKECKKKSMKFSCNIVGGDVDHINNSSLKYLEKLNEDLDLSDEIKFLGNREDIPELLAQSDLFILPSRFEGLPVALLEAMAARLPVIASNISGSAEILEHERNGLLFESENYLDLADKIFYLYNHREEMKRLEQNAYEYVHGFDISMMCEKYWELYKRLIQ